LDDSEIEGTSGVSVFCAEEPGQEVGMKFLHRAELFLLIVFLCCGSAFSQTSSTSLRGTVTDASGGGVAGATVTLKNTESGAERATTTDAQGQYQFVQLPAGTYALTLSAKGFANYQRTGLVLLVNTPVTANAQLKIGTATQSVTVSGEAPPLNLVDASLGNSFGQNQVQDIPLDGRNVPELLSLQPGVVFTGNTLSTSLAAYKDQDTRNGSVNGARSDQSNITLDGVDVNDQNSGYAFTSVLPITQDSVQEFRVTTSNYTADAGTGSGAQTALITRSGSNQWHGSAYEYLRNTATSANDYLTKRAQIDSCTLSGTPLSDKQCNQPLKLIRNVFGGTVGGPIVKDRLFFFFNYEGTRLREQQSVVRNIPTVSLRDGVMIYQCSDPTQCPGGSVAGISNTKYTFGPGYVGLSPTDIQNLDPMHAPLNANSYMIQYFKATYGNLVTNDLSVGDNFNYSGYRWSAPFNLNNNAAIARIDYNITAKGSQTLFVRGALQQLDNPQAPFLPGTTPEQTLIDFSKGTAVGYTALIGSSMVNSFHWGFTRQSTGFVGNSNQPWNTFYTLDTSFTYSHNFQMPVNNLLDDFSWTKGKHTIEIGGNVGIARDPRMSYQHSYSQGKGATFWMNPVAFANTAPGNGACLPGGSPLDPCYLQTSPSCNFQACPEPASNNAYDYPMLGLLGMVSLVNSNWNYKKDGTPLNQGDPVKRDYGLNWYEFYGQDSWRFKPNWTINLGLRWSIFPPPWEVNGLQASPNVNLGKFFGQNVQNMQNGMGYADVPVISFGPGGRANNKQGFYNTQMNNFSPRISVAYSPRARGGWLKSLFGDSDQTVIRGGFSMVYDRAGMQLINTFDANAPAGYSTSLTNPCCVDGAAQVPRITDIHNVENLVGSTPYFQNAPSGTFPQTPPSGYPGGQAITWGVDQSLKTPYAYVVDFSIGRELPHGYTLQLAYIGRFGHNLLTQRDLMQPLDLVDPKSKVDYFKAATAISKLASAQGVNALSLTPAQFDQALGSTAVYWKNLLNANSNGVHSPCAAPPCFASGASYYVMPNGAATTDIAQAAYALYVLSGAFAGDEVVGLGNIDLYGYLVDNLGTPYYFNGETGEMLNQQFTTSYAWSSIGSSNYNGFQTTVKKQLRNGVQFDFNYTYSKSIDITSAAARLGYSGTDNVGPPGSRLVNAFDPQQFRAVSDFDTTHQFNANWLAELPFGRGKPFGRNASSALNALIGGWQLTGIVRWTSGFPFSVDNGQFWATNWDEQGSAQLIAKPKTGVFKNPATGAVSVFADPATALNDFVHPYPGQGGSRNALRGSGYAGWDMGLNKSWNLPREGQAIQFRWEVFNVANLTRFNVLAGLGDGAPSLQQSPTTFGNYAGLLTNPRVMQFALRYQF
jgi:carboxypeptidase family protein